MSYTIPEVVLEKSSRILNITFVVFGYVLASYLISPLDLLFEQKLSSLLILGGVLGTFLYYLYPIERILALYLRIRKFDKIVFSSSADKSFAYDKTEILSSPLLREDIAKITGAFFFSISLLLSERLLNIVQINLPLWTLVFSALVILAIGIWETRVFLRQKMDYVMYYLYFSRFERPVASELLDAIEKKDWPGAHNIINRSLYMGSIFAQRGGICFKCKTIQTDGPYCSACGTLLISYCNECKSPIVREGAKEVPVYCLTCGKELKDNKETPS